MRIIKETDLNNWKLIVTCTDCISKLEINEFDIFRNYDYPSNNDYCINCLVCEIENLIDKYSIPEFIKYRVRERIRNEG